VSKGVFLVGTLQTPVIYSLRVDDIIRTPKPSVIVEMNHESGGEFPLFDGILVAEDGLRYHIAKVKGNTWVGKQE